MRQPQVPFHEAAILSRMIGPEAPVMSAATARGILTLAFSPADRDSMRALAALARAGQLTDDDRSRIEAYSRVSSLLGILKSKARRALRSRRADGKAKVR